MTKEITNDNVHDKRLEHLTLHLIRESITCLQVKPVSKLLFRKVDFTHDILDCSSVLIGNLLSFSLTFWNRFSVIEAYRVLVSILVHNKYWSDDYAESFVRQIAHVLADSTEKISSIYSFLLNTQLYKNIVSTKPKLVSPAVKSLVSMIDPDKILATESHYTLINIINAVYFQYENNKSAFINAVNYRKETKHNHVITSKLIDSHTVSSQHALLPLALLKSDYMSKLLSVPQSDHGKGRSLELMNYIVSTGYQCAFHYEDLRVFLDETDLSAPLMYVATQDTSGFVSRIPYHLTGSYLNPFGDTIDVSNTPNIWTQ